MEKRKKAKGKRQKERGKSENILLLYLFEQV
jgi:hypothetical protein